MNNSQHVHGSRARPGIGLLNEPSCRSPMEVERFDRQGPVQRSPSPGRHPRTRHPQKPATAVRISPASAAPVSPWPPRRPDRQTSDADARTRKKPKSRNRKKPPRRRQEKLAKSRAENCDRAPEATSSRSTAGTHRPHERHKGEREILDDQGRAQEREPAREAISIDCRQSRRPRAVQRASCLGPDAAAYSVGAAPPSGPPSTDGKTRPHRGRAPVYGALARPHMPARGRQERCRDAARNMPLARRASKRCPRASEAHRLVDLPRLRRSPLDFDARGGADHAGHRPARHA